MERMDNVPMPTRPQFGGIVLCGGQSTRMGRPKLLLPFGDETMLIRVVRILQGVVTRIVVVAAVDQQLPDLPHGVRIARDEQEGMGPLQGIAAGLAALQSEVDATFVTACDTPLLKPAFIEFLIDKLEEYDVVVPREGEFYHPLAGVYRTRLVSKCRSLIDQQRLRPKFLIDESSSRVLEVSELRKVDPDLESLRNTNTEQEYKAALELAGLDR